MANRYLIVGFGQTGWSCARYFLKQGVAFAINDSREQPPCVARLSSLDSHIRVELGHFSPELFDWATHLVVSPGVSLSQPLIAKAMTQGKSLLSDVELFCSQVSLPIIAITGSNGKSTVATMVYQMLLTMGKRAVLAGNIGLPVLDILDQDLPQVLVLELSSFQLERLSSLSATVATVLNICPDHLDQHHSMDSYMSAKQHIYDGCQNAVFNRQQSWLYAPKIIATGTSFGLDKADAGHWGILETEGKRYMACGQQPLLAVQQLASQHDYFVLNALAALALGEAYGICREDMAAALMNFEALPHRCQLVGQFAAVHWYNDSKATNVGATVAVVESVASRCQGRLMLIAGGVAKGADFSLLRAVVDRCVSTVILMGEAAPQLEQCLQGAADIRRASSLAQAVALAAAIARAGDGVLLSPACASFDRFDNFEHRGREFMSLVQDIYR